MGLETGSYTYDRALQTWRIRNIQISESCLGASTGHSLANFLLFLSTAFILCGQTFGSLDARLKRPELASPGLRNSCVVACTRASCHNVPTDTTQPEETQHCTGQTEGSPACSPAADELPAVQRPNSAVRPHAEDGGGQAALQGEHAVATVRPTRYILQPLAGMPMIPRGTPEAPPPSPPCNLCCLGRRHDVSRGFSPVLISDAKPRTIPFPPLHKSARTCW